MTRFREGEWWHIPIIQEVLKCYEEPRTYVEIGVSNATCFNQIYPLVQNAHGVDYNEVSGHLMVGGTFYHMTSDEFFEVYDDTSPHMIFIDGDHSFEQVKKDFENALKIINPNGTIALHDTFSLGDRACGAVDKVFPLINKWGCNYYTFKTWPGLTLVQL